MFHEERRREAVREMAGNGRVLSYEMFNGLCPLALVEGGQCDKEVTVPFEERGLKIAKGRQDEAVVSAGVSSFAVAASQQKIPNGTRQERAVRGVNRAGVGVDDV